MNEINQSVTEPSFTGLSSLCSEPISYNGSANLDHTEPTMMYIFKRFENVQNECNEMKTKMYRLKSQIGKMEKRDAIHSTEIQSCRNETQVCKRENELLRKRLSGTQSKYYYSLTFNIVLTTILVKIYLKT